MHNIHKRKQHLLCKRRNLCYLLIYTRSESFVDVLLLTSETLHYRSAVEQSLNRSNPRHWSAGEDRDEEFFAFVLHCWNNIWKRRWLRGEEQKPPYQGKAIIYLLTVVKVGQGGQYKCLGGWVEGEAMIGIRKAGDTPTSPHCLHREETQSTKKVYWIKP